MIFFKSDIDKIMPLTMITPAEKLVIIGLMRHGLTARDISAVSGTSPRAVYYALDNLTAQKVIQNNAGIYALTKDYIHILCKKCKTHKSNARAYARTKKPH